MYINKEIEFIKNFLKNKMNIIEVSNLVTNIENIYNEYNKDYSKYSDNYKKTMENAFNKLKIRNYFNNEGIIEEYRIGDLIKTFEEYYNDLKNLKYLKFLSEEKKTVVFVGANGSGKTSLLRKLIKTTGEEKIGYYPAERLMLINKNYNPKASLALLKEEIRKDNAYLFDMENFKWGVDNQFDQAIDLFQHKHHLEADTLPKDKWFTNELLEIWNSLIKKRILYSEEVLKVKTLEGKEYDLKYLSNGEKTCFYFLASILLKERKEYYFIDEPDNSLNNSIVSKLWDIIEEKCPDSIFVYLTHDNNFAASRINSKIYWIKNFDGETWEYETLPENENFPQELVISLVGSHSPVLFCESNDEYKYDVLLFKLLFKEYKIISTGGCSSVLAKVKAYQKLKLPTKAIGIIDCDYKSLETLERLKKNNIYHFPFFEIENFLFCEEIIIGLLKEYSLNPSAFSLLKQKLKESFINNKEQWIIRNIAFNLHDTKYNKKINSLKTYTELKNNFNSWLKEINLDNLYQKYLKLYNDILTKDDYNTYLRYYDNKGLYNTFKNILKLKNKENYFNIVFVYLKNHQEVLDKIRNTYFKEI